MRVHRMCVCFCCCFFPSYYLPIQQLTFSCIRSDNDAHRVVVYNEPFALCTFFSFSVFSLFVIVINNFFITDKTLKDRQYTHSKPFDEQGKKTIIGLIAWFDHHQPLNNWLYEFLCFCVVSFFFFKKTQYDCNRIYKTITGIFSGRKWKLLLVAAGHSSKSMKCAKLLS